jgi:hypothetical protein
MRNISLNGWQRLWVLVGVIYACAVAVFCFFNYPNKLTIAEHLGAPDVELGNNVPTQPVRYVQIKEKWIKVEHTARNKEKDECVYLRNNAWSEPIRCSDLNLVDLPREFNDSDIHTLNLKRARFIGIAALFWAVPFAVIYVFGAGVGWVIKGFRKI